MPEPITVAAPAGFWLRLAATFIDWLLITIVNTIVGVLAMALPPLVLLVFFTDWLYRAAFESSRRQATLGKQALGLIVTDEAGRPISFGRATGRYFASIISWLILGIGFMMAGWTQRRQALHDMIAGTLVVKR